MARKDGVHRPPHQPVLHPSYGPRGAKKMPMNTTGNRKNHGGGALGEVGAARAAPAPMTQTAKKSRTKISPGPTTYHSIRGRPCQSTRSPLWSTTSDPNRGSLTRRG